MYFILGMIRSTILYFGLVSVIKASSFEAFYCIWLQFSSMLCSVSSQKMTDPQVKLFSAFWVMIPLRPFSA